MNGAPIAGSPFPVYVSPSDAAVGVIVAVVLVVVGLAAILGFVIYKRRQVSIHRRGTQASSWSFCGHGLAGSCRNSTTVRDLNADSVNRPRGPRGGGGHGAPTQIKKQQKEWARKKAAAYKEYQIDGSQPVPLAAQQNSKEPEWEDNTGGDQWDENMLQVRRGWQRGGADSTARDKRQSARPPRGCAHPSRRENPVEAAERNPRDADGPARVGGHAEVAAAKDWRIRADQRGRLCRRHGNAQHGVPLSPLKAPLVSAARARPAQTPSLQTVSLRPMRADAPRANEPASAADRGLSYSSFSLSLSLSRWIPSIVFVARVGCARRLCACASDGQAL